MEKNTRKLVTYLLWEFVIFIGVIIAISFFHNYLPEDVQESLLDVLPKALIVVIIFVLTKVTLSFLKPVFEKTFQKDDRSQAEVKMMWQFFSKFVWVIIIIYILLIMIGNIPNLLPWAVIIAALLWVLQNPILNIIGWLDITFHGPYSVGDRIEIDGRKGFVVKVGMLHTTIREIQGWMAGETYTGRLISIPNSSIFETPIVNYTRNTPYIYDEIKIAITYESDHKLAKKLILEETMKIVGDKMKEHSKIMAYKMDVKDLKSDLIQGPIVRTEFSESSVIFYVIFSCEVNKRRAVRSEITERILEKIKSEDKVKIAYPHMEVVGIGK
jgi:small-conductance mechanosensitive channel